MPPRDAVVPVKKRAWSGLGVMQQRKSLAKNKSRYQENEHVGEREENIAAKNKVAKIDDKRRPMLCGV